MSKIDSSKITADFSESYPEDKKLTALFTDAYSGKLLVRMTVIKTEGIKPFSKYIPPIIEGYINFFEGLEKEETPPPIYVYPDDKYFIMSDDYNAYHTYLRKGYTEIPCILMGDSNSDFILDKSEPFELPAPELSEIEKENSVN
jgi:hypothetical protein